MSVHRIPIKFHHGIHRILAFVTGYEQAAYMDQHHDLTDVFYEEVVNTSMMDEYDETYVSLDLYDLNGTMGCLAMGSEFGIFSLSRSNDGAVHLIDTRRNAIPFLMSVVHDYDLGLHAVTLLSKRSEHVLGSSAHIASMSLFGHWREIARLILAATITANEPVTYERALLQFGELLERSDNQDLIAQFGVSGGFEDALEKLGAVGLISRNRGRIEVVKDSAVLFLTSVDDRPLLTKLAAHNG